MTPAQLKTLRGEAVDGRGNRIAAACRIAERTQMEVARGTGLSPQKVSDVVNGRVPNMRVETARKFADFFGCSIEDLFPSREEVA